MRGQPFILSGMLGALSEMGRPCTQQRIENALASEGGLGPEGLSFAQFYHVVETELRHSRHLCDTSALKLTRLFEWQGPRALLASFGSDPREPQDEHWHRILLRIFCL